MGLKPRISLPEPESKGGVPTLSWIGEVKGGEKTVDNEFPEVAKGVLLAIMRQERELHGEFEVFEIAAGASIELFLERASVVEAGESAPEWNSFEVHIPWKGDGQSGTVYAEVEGRSLGDRVLTDIWLMRVT